MQNNTKSSAVAGILGVFLGWVGGHDWYLGNTKKAITHVCLSVGGFLLLMVGIILNNLTAGVMVINVLFICVIIASYVILIGNAVWGFIEGVIIIAQGDAGLAAKGYKVADPASTTMTIGNPTDSQPNSATSTAQPAHTDATTSTTSQSISTANIASTSNNSTPTPTKATEEKTPEPPIEPAHLDNIITATPAASGIMQSSVPMGNATPEVNASTSVSPTTTEASSPAGINSTAAEANTPANPTNSTATPAPAANAPSATPGAPAAAPAPVPATPSSIAPADTTPATSATAPINSDATPTPPSPAA